MRFNVDRSLDHMCTHFMPKYIVETLLEDLPTWHTNPQNTQDGDWGLCAGALGGTADRPFAVL